MGMGLKANLSTKAPAAKSPQESGLLCRLSSIYSSCTKATPIKDGKRGTKAFAIWEALSWVKLLRVKNVMIESNYQVIVNVLTCPLDDVSQLSMLSNMKPAAWLAIKVSSFAWCARMKMDRLKQSEL
ncbi:hypothetical protein Goarm_008724, partial [Gossypium armourianum]|nr:hypothetical protein [Gossypium armourianum]